MHEDIQVVLCPCFVRESASLEVCAGSKGGSRALFSEGPCSPSRNSSLEEYSCGSFFDTPAMENLKFKVQQVKYLGEQAEYRPRRLENLIFVLWPGTTGTSQVVLGFPDAFILGPYFTTA